MASAGRVLLLPKGTWTAGTSYVPLDYVLYNGSSYVCKTATNGSTNPESDTSHWQKLTQGLTSTELSEVQSVVGDVADLKTDKINHTDALSKEEIAASTDLTGKVPSAAAFSQLNSDLGNIILIQKVTSTIHEVSGWGGTYGADITAPNINGYVFVTWLTVATSGWVGIGYVGDPLMATTRAYFPPIQSLANDREISVIAMYQKK